MPAEAKAMGLWFFEEFWRQGGSDIALMKAACSRAKVFAQPTLLSFSLFFTFVCYFVSFMPITTSLLQDNEEKARIGELVKAYMADRDAKEQERRN